MTPRVFQSAGRVHNPARAIRCVGDQPARLRSAGRRSPARGGADRLRRPVRLAGSTGDHVARLGHVGPVRRAAVLLVGVGLHATIVGVRSELNGFDDWMIGLIGAAYYGGFLLGSRLALPALSQVGHIRVFAALASLLAASMIAIGLTDSAWLWVALRVVSGMLIAGQYVVVESWLNQLDDERDTRAGCSACTWWSAPASTASVS